MAAPSTRLSLRLSPGARQQRHGTIDRHGDGWKVRVAAVPEAGKANEALLRLLAERLRLPRRSLTLVSGRTGRDKIVKLDGIDAADVERRLAKAGERP
jgi:uncharacterized protein